MKFVFYGSSILSAYWNGAATYYRGICKELHNRGHSVTFIEPDAYERQKHRDFDSLPYARVLVYKPDQVSVDKVLEEGYSADIVVKTSGVGVFDEYLEKAVLNLKAPDRKVIFWDVDAPATLQRVKENEEDPFLICIPEYDSIFTYGGGPPVQHAYRELGAVATTPIYNALDPDTHHPVEKADDYAVDLFFLGNRLPDRETRVEEFFLKPASKLPKSHFAIGGNGWNDKVMPNNVRKLGHIYTNQHNMLNCSAKTILNISRDSMAGMGYSPATRVFEAAGAGACIITDAFKGIDTFFVPSEEILVANSGEEVAYVLSSLANDEAEQIGARAKERALKHHTYAQRAHQVEELLQHLLLTTATII